MHLPHDVQAEKCLLQLWATDLTLVERARTVGVTADDFFDEGYRRLAQVMTHMARAGCVQYDPVVLQQSRDVLEVAIPPAKEVAELFEINPGIANFQHYVDIIGSHSRNRRMRCAAYDAITNGKSEEEVATALRAAVDVTTKPTDIIGCNPVAASELGRSEDMTWVWEGYLAHGCITLLVGLWKAGKSTLLAHLLRAMSAGGELATRVTAGKALIITEEGSSLWAMRRDDVGFGDNCYFDIRPFKSKATVPQWNQYVQAVAKEVERGGYDLCVFDTWQAVNPSKDENDASGTMAALLPLHAITEAGAAVLLAHHPRKGDASEGQACRGSGALTGFVDTIVELRRYDAERPDDRRRKLKGLSRFEETPVEVVIELDNDGYRLIGSTGEAKRADRLTVLEDILTDEDWLSVDEISRQWPDDVVRPGKKTLKRDLDHGYDNGLWIRDGLGKKGSPHTYKFDSGQLPPYRPESNPVPF